jgi:hypothetical protein
MRSRCVRIFGFAQCRDRGKPEYDLNFACGHARSLLAVPSRNLKGEAKGILLNPAVYPGDFAAVWARLVK